MKRDILSITDLSAKEIWHIFSLAKKLKHEFRTYRHCEVASGDRGNPINRDCFVSFDKLRIPRNDNCEIHVKAKSELKILSSELLKGKSLALIFEKQSLRTRISFEIGMAQLGGHVVYLDPRDTGIGYEFRGCHSGDPAEGGRLQNPNRSWSSQDDGKCETRVGVREPTSDIAKVLSSMASVIAARTYAHQTIVDLANNASIPVINALSDLEHPCQALTDLFTIWEIGKMRGIGGIRGLKIAYVGDGDNNVAHSLCLGSSMLNIQFACASPKGYWMNGQIVKKAKEYNGSIAQTVEPKEAVENADVVVTDTWVSMGDTDKETRMKKFQSYQVNKSLMKYAKKDAIFMHCLPAYRGNEVSAEVIDGPQSIVFVEAENRLHVQKALLLYILK